MRFLILLALLATTPALAAMDDFPAKRARADLLFPEAAGWPQVDSLPVVPGLAADAALLDRLTAAAFPDEPRDNDGDTCSTRFRMRTKPEIAALIRQGDLFGTARRDMIYADFMICAEGLLTVIWRDVDAPGGPKAVAYWGRALRVEKARNPRITLIREGCCGALDDYYLMRRLGQPQPPGDDFYLGALRAVHASVVLDTPPGGKAASAKLTLKAETTLLPEPDDTPPPPVAPDDVDEFEVSPGTYATYPAGTGLDQVMTHGDAKGRRWALVIGPLTRSAQDRPMLNLGWIRRP